MEIFENRLEVTNPGVPLVDIMRIVDNPPKSLFSYLEFANISMEDKLWATYLHACIKFMEGQALTNTSLRERFGLSETAAGSISRLIKEAVNKNLIRPVDPTTARKHMRYYHMGMI